MKRERIGDFENLESLYEKKILILKELSKNLHRQLEILSFGDGEGAAKLSFQNEKIIQKLAGLDERIGNIRESSPQSSKLISLSENIFSLLEETRYVQGRVTELFEHSLHLIKKELNVFQVKMQVQKYLRNRDGMWKTTTC